MALNKKLMIILQIVPFSFATSLIHPIMHTEILATLCRCHRVSQKLVLVFTGKRCQRCNQAPVVQQMDSNTHWINHYLQDNSVKFDSTCLLDSDLSSGCDISNARKSISSGIQTMRSGLKKKVQAKFLLTYHEVF